MSKYEFKESWTTSDLETLYDNLLPYDKIEVSLIYPTKADFVREMQGGLDWGYCVWVEEEPAAIFGVASVPEKEGYGVPFLLRTDELLKCKVPFIKQSRKWVEKMQENYDVLVNHVHAENYDAIRWLQFCGFEIAKEPLFLNKVPLLTFWRFKNV